MKSAYQAAISIARTLGMQDVIDLLTENLDEEMAAAANIQKRQPILLESAQEPGTEEGDARSLPRRSTQREPGLEEVGSTRKRAS
jgi:hypothetical protein